MVPVETKDLKLGDEVMLFADKIVSKDMSGVWLEVLGITRNPRGGLRNVFVYDISQSNRYRVPAKYVKEARRKVG